MTNTLQTGKTRWTHYQIAYHFVWIPKYRRRILTGEVQKVTKQSIEACCATHGFVLLVLETDEDHVHCFVSAPPKDAPSKIVGLLKGRWLRAKSRQASFGVCTHSWGIPERAFAFFQPCDILVSQRRTRRK